MRVDFNFQKTERVDGEEDMEGGEGGVCVNKMWGIRKGRRSKRGEKGADRT
jgi:hypothetical protein